MSRELCFVVAGLLYAVTCSFAVAASLITRKIIKEGL